MDVLYNKNINIEFSDISCGFDGTTYEGYCEIKEIKIPIDNIEDYIELTIRIKGKKGKK